MTIERREEELWNKNVFVYLNGVMYKRIRTPRRRHVILIVGYFNEETKGQTCFRPEHRSDPR